MKKYIDLPEELLIGAYNILYHINDRPACVKANRVRKILAGEVTPGCSAATWWEFFNFLDAKLAPARPAPLSPAEWLAQKYGPHLPDLPIGKVMQEMEAYAAHVVNNMISELKKIT